ncbi:MAG: carbohydrate ABC transporter permease [Geminicoccaceae bacterium]|nr:carbohydrate ABC transporter permease [Geminicoccaceae bacterium]MCB9945481.1 carbohydrate ABC transporter permease [Geminicoccaceae bacterium]
MKKLIRSVLYWIIFMPLVIVILFPYAVMLSTALKPRSEIFVFTPTWLPSKLMWSNFVDMWNEIGFGHALMNSLVVSGSSVVLCLLAAIPAGYAMARYRFRGQPAYRQFLLITQMLSPIVLVLGIFRMMAAMGFVDQPVGLILAYGAFNMAFATWMLQSYFATIPLELEEAAWIDGANWLQSLRLIFLPLAVPALAVTAILTFVNTWNEFVLAFTLLRSQESYTLTIRIYSLVGAAYKVNWDHVMAATLLATLPVAVVFSWLQRFMVKGLALGSVK